MTIQHTEQLRALLQKRLTVIADQDLRARSPERHLEALQAISEALAGWHQQHRAILPPRLNHFMIQASYGKALDYLDQPDN